MRALRASSYFIRDMISQSAAARPEDRVLGMKELEGRDIVCVGTADWATELPVNQHQLMRRLAKTNRVLFVESLGLRKPQIAGRDLRRMATRLRRGLRGARRAGRLHVLSPLVLPLHHKVWVRELNRRLLRFQVGRAARRLGLHDPILWGYAPQAEALIQVLRPSLVVYHCVDDLAAQKGVEAEAFTAAERSYARTADLVLASAPVLAERMRIYSENVLYVPNVADTALFARALEPGPVDPAIAALPRPRLVFQGAVVATKVDFDLLAEVATTRPDWSIVLVGPHGAGDPGSDLSAVRALPNIILVGRRDEHELPDVLRGSDVGLIPYKINPLTNSVFPMKVYEYLAAGLPVIATQLPALQGVDGVEAVTDAAGLVEAVEREIARDDPEQRLRRSAGARAHSWEARIDEIELALSALKPS
jgi:glycosyltransferase involved in cell wall biosynthesis